MCNGTFNERLAPLSQHHLHTVQELYPHQATFADEVYQVLRDSLTPQANLLVAFVALKEQFDQGVRGIFSAFGRVLYAPLSIVARTDKHQWTRFRPQEVDELHTSFLSFMMAKPNRLALNDVFGRYGLAFSQGHCCGILFGAIEDVSRYEASELFAIRNEMRSYAEAMGMPVVTCPFATLPTITSDLGPAEREFYALYESMFEAAPEVGRDAYVDTSMDERWAEIVAATLSSHQVEKPAFAKAA